MELMQYIITNPFPLKGLFLGSLVIIESIFRGLKYAKPNTRSINTNPIFMCTVIFRLIPNKTSMTPQTVIQFIAKNRMNIINA
jgi:hypothetical protein